MKTGRFAIYNGKEYMASLETDKKYIELCTYDQVDEKNGFKKEPFGLYSKKVKLIEIDEIYDIKAKFDFMGQTHEANLSADGKTFCIYVNDSSYKQYGFVEDYDMTYTNRFIGYKKEFTVAESPLRFVKIPVRTKEGI